jgi:GntR family transcriptional regulator, transcriptional repressor for pyruvate dehydrogenase complex
MADEDDKLPAFGRLSREPRLSDKVADLLLETIVSKGLRPGDRLPSERELGEQFGVSRTVIREAVRALAAKGVIDARTGSGLRVSAVGPSAVAESMQLFLLGSTSLDYGKVHEVRTIIEVQAAQVAAERADEDDLADLRSVCSRMAEVLEDRDAAAQADVDFHRDVADCAHNELYGVMLDSISGPLLDVRRETMALAGRAREALDDHERILERIEAHDAIGAREAMREHLEDVRISWDEALRRAQRLAKKS